MKEQLNKIKDPMWVMKRLLIILIVVFFISIRSLLWYAVRGVAYAFLLAYLLKPIVVEFEKREWPRFLAVLFVWLIIIVTIIITIVLFMPIIIQQLSLFSLQWQNLKVNEGIKQKLVSVFSQDMVLRMIEQLRSFPLKIGQQINAHINSEFMDELTLYIVIPILSFYMMLEREKWNLAFLHLIPPKWRSEASHLSRKLNLVMGRWVRAQLLISLIVFVLSTLSLSLVNQQYAILLGLINGIANLIPYFGPVIGALPGILLVFLNNLSIVVPTILIYGVILFIKSMLLTPLIVGKNIQRSPALILVSLLIGGQLFGVIGLLLAVPCLVLIGIVIDFFAGFNVKRYGN